MHLSTATGTSTRWCPRLMLTLLGERMLVGEAVESSLTLSITGVWKAASLYASGMAESLEPS